METLRKEYAEHKKTLFLALAATYLWGLLAHGYCFFEYSFSHDSLVELHGAIFGNDWKISLGRVFVPLYRDLVRSDVTLPWLIGVLSLFWIGLSVFLTARVLDIRSRLLVFLTAGIYTANITVSATAATYLHDLDCYMFSLLCAVAAVYCWKFCRWGMFFGAVLLAVSMGMYQGFLSVAITLVMFVCIFQLLNEASFRTVFLRGLKAVAMILIGGGLYAVAVKIIQQTSGVAMLDGNYNSMSQMEGLTLAQLPELIKWTYRDWLMRLVNAVNAYPGILVKGTLAVLTVIGIAALMVGLMNKKVGRWEKLLCIVLVALLPLGMHAIYVLTRGVVHELMVFAIWLTYLFGLLLSEFLVRWMERKGHFTKRKLHRWIGAGTAFLVALVLYGNVQFANGMYLKKDLERGAFMSYMTRVVGQIEAQDGYQTGQTQVYFAGVPRNLYSMPAGFREYSLVSGMEKAELLQIDTRQRYQLLFDYLLGVPLRLVEQETWDALQEHETIAAMSCYPDQGCMQMLDDVLVVKLGN